MFYHYSQNNSGGKFGHDPKRGISHHVIIEAASADEANQRAEYIGLYFDGEGDCECCGNRWSPMYRDDAGETAPLVYGETPSAWANGRWNIWNGSCFIHYLDGSVMEYAKGIEDAEVL